MDVAIVDEWGEILDFAFGLADEDQVEQWAAHEAYNWGHPSPRLVQLGERSGICIGATVDTKVHHMMGFGLVGLAYRCDCSCPHIDRPLPLHPVPLGMSSDVAFSAAGAGMGS